MRVKAFILLLASVLIFSCQNTETTSNTTSQAQKDSLTYQKIINRYSYDQLKQMLYLKESQINGLVVAKYQVFKPFLSKKYIINLRLENHAIIVPYHNFGFEIKFFDQDGKLLGQIRKNIDIISYPQQRTEYNIVLDEYPTETSKIIVNLVHYEPMPLDSLKVEN